MSFSGSNLNMEKENIKQWTKILLLTHITSFLYVDCSYEGFQHMGRVTWYETWNPKYSLICFLLGLCENDVIT